MQDAGWKMSSMRPFLVVALRDWILANGMTPHLKANTNIGGMMLPGDLLTAHPEVVLNIAPQAVDNFRCEDEGVSFGATFNRTFCSIFIPYAAIDAVYARETGQGMAMPAEPLPSPPPDDADKGSGKTGKSRAHLRVVK